MCYRQPYQHKISNNHHLNQILLLVKLNFSALYFGRLPGGGGCSPGFGSFGCGGGGGGIREVINIFFSFSFCSALHAAFRLRKCSERNLS